jgi:hypothetical protein
LFDDGAHERGGQLMVERAESGAGSRRGGQDRELARDGGFIQVVADADAQTGDQSGSRPGGGGDGALVFPRKRGGNEAKDAVVDGAGMLDEGAILRQLGRDQALVAPEDGERLPRRMLG